MVFAILNFHFDYLNPSLINCNGLQAPSQVNSTSRFAQKDVCIDGLFCIDDDHQHHGPGQERDDPPMCFQVLKP